MHLHFVSRKNAKEHGLVKYYTGQCCKYGHMCERFTYSSTCCECHREISIKHFNKSKQYYIKQSAKWKKDNPEKVKEMEKRTYYKNIGRYKQWYQDNKEKVAIRQKQYRKDNKGMINSWTRRRQADLLKRTPKWINQDLVVEIYQIAHDLTILTGIQFHVDHIIPLRGKKVSGLHVHYNLQILPFYENLSKGNQHV